MALSFYILGLRNFRLLVMTRMFAHMGLQSLAVIIGWQIYSLTHSELLLGLIGLTEAVPAIIASLFSGYVVDISTPLKVYRLCVIGLLLNLLFLTTVGGGHIGLENQTLIPLLFVGIFISGIARSFMMPSYSALMPQIVERKDYAAGAAWSNAGFQVAVITGPVLAGLIYGYAGVESAWILPAGFMALSVLTALNIHNVREYEKPEAKGSPLRNIIDGWSFILTHRMLLTVMAVDMVAVLFGGAVAMLPAYADQILHVGPEGLGLLRTAPALGAIGAALYFAVRPMKRFPLSRMLFAVAGFAVCMIAFGLSTSFALSIACLALSGLFDTVSVIIRATLKQILTPDAMRGRVAAISSMFIISSNEIGAFESGVAARMMGLVPSVVFGGVVSLLAVAATYALTPNLRKKVYTHEE